MTSPYGSPVPSPVPESPLSINFRVPEIPGGPQLTVRAGNGVELAGLTDDVARNGAQIGRALTEFRAGLLAGAGMPDSPQASPAAPAAQPQQTYQPQNPTAGYGQAVPQYGAPAPAPQYAVPQQNYSQPPQTGGQGPAPMCPHGQRVYRAGVNSKGTPYKMWACPAPQSDPSQCKPEWVK